MAVNKKVLNPDISDYLLSLDIDINVKGCLREVSTGRPGNLQQNVSGHTYCMSKQSCILQRDNSDYAMPYCSKTDIYKP